MARRKLGRMPVKHVELIFERSGGLCEGCWGARADEIHHRRFKSRGGRHNMANLAHLCQTCHKRAHGLVEGAGEGWAISQYERAGECAVPFVDMRGKAWLFDDEGVKREA